MAELVGLQRLLPAAAAVSTGRPVASCSRPTRRLRGRRIDARMGVAVGQRARLAGVEQDDRLLRLDAVGDPVLQALLADGAARRAPSGLVPPW